MLRFIPLSSVRVTDAFWRTKQQLVREVVLPYQWETLNDRVPGAAMSHCVENFRVAAGQAKGEHGGAVFQDSDLYKWLEAVAYCLAVERDATLEAAADGAIALIEAAQEPDGYLNTYYTLNTPGERWRNLMEGHELYCAGHLIEAAVAYAAATGKRRCLDIALRLADCIDRAFGPEEGKLHGYAGHPEIELALITLYQATNDPRYLRLAAYFVDVRGAAKENWFEAERRREGHRFIWPIMGEFDPTYFQAHAPVREQMNAEGHAVRAMYLYAACADLARIQGDPSLKEACERLYESATGRRMYVTGGVGSASFGERFTVDFDLPNDSAYAETCASVGLMMLASRMFLLTGDARYYDGFERALYNNILAGMGADGRRFFYVNPLSVVPERAKGNKTLEHVKTTRQKWFGVSCCPPNIARALASLGGGLYATEPGRLHLLSHIASTFQTEAMSGELTRVGDCYSLTIDAPAMEIILRAPEGFRFEGESRIAHPGGRAVYRYRLTPQVRLIRADPRVEADAGKVCVMRGQQVYCLEEADNGKDLCAIHLPSDAKFAETSPDFLPESAPALVCEGFRALPHADGALYAEHPPRLAPEKLTFIPYCHWNNRGEGEMRVWINELIRTGLSENGTVKTVPYDMFS